MKLSEMLRIEKDFKAVIMGDRSQKRPRVTLIFIYLVCVRHFKTFLFPNIEFIWYFTPYEQIIEYFTVLKIAFTYFSIKHNILLYYSNAFEYNNIKYYYVLDNLVNFWDNHIISFKLSNVDINGIWQSKL